MRVSFIEGGSLKLYDSREGVCWTELSRQLNEILEIKFHKLKLRIYMHQFNMHMMRWWPGIMHAGNVNLRMHPLSHPLLLKLYIYL